MEDVHDSRTPIQEFMDEYQDDLYTLHEEAKARFIEAHMNIGISNAEHFLIEMEDSLLAIRSLSSIEEKVRRVMNSRKACCATYYQLAYGKDDTSFDLFKEFEDKIYEIINKVKSYNKRLIKEAENSYCRIQTCPFGEQENRTRNALTFQKESLQLLDWLFINELQRMDLSEIEDGSQRRDGGYGVLPEFDTEERCLFPFNHLFIECKNYKKPSYHDLMQVLSYTLYCQQSHIFKIPLSILVSRGNPTSDSTACRLRSVIFKRRIEDEERLILFMDEKDLKDMLECKKKGGDPASIIKEKVIELGKWNMRHGAYY